MAASKVALADCCELETRRVVGIPSAGTKSHTCPRGLVGAYPRESLAGAVGNYNCDGLHSLTLSHKSRAPRRFEQESSNFCAPKA
eukprot:1134912-Rhodomonas_salina.1